MSSIPWQYFQRKFGSMLKLLKNMHPNSHSLRNSWKIISKNMLLFRDPRMRWNICLQISSFTLCRPDIYFCHIIYLYIIYIYIYICSYIVIPYIKWSKLAMSVPRWTVNSNHDCDETQNELECFIFVFFFFFVNYHYLIGTKSPSSF